MNALEPVYRDIDAGVPYDYENVPRLKAIVNFGTNLEHPIHGWYYFKEGFAPGIVHWAFQRFANPAFPDHVARRGARLVHRAESAYGPLVLDPFSGSGTTALTCQFAGIDALGIEHNPFLTFVGQTKLAWPRYEPDTLDALLPDLTAPGGTPAIEPPNLSSFGRLYTADALADLLLVKERIARLDEPLSRCFFHLALAAIVERTSLARKDGKGLKVVRRPMTPAPVREAFTGQARRMIEDLRKRADVRERARLADASIRQGDARRLAGVTDKSVDMIVYSPPYLNSFDYAEVYKLEMWLLDFVQTASEFRQVRGSSLRSHVSAPISPTGYLNYPPLTALIEAIDQANLWNPRIPAMIEAYFDDMYLALAEQARVLKPGAYLVCVVANSAYGGVPIPTDALLARIGQRLGLVTDGIYVARRMNTSAQQLARWGGSRTYLRESAVVMQKL
ncbi:MAG: hypothetical protein U0768_16680 [Anaerolineae bacterium]